MIKLFIFIGLLVSNAAFSAPNTLVCRKPANGWVQRLTLSYISDSEATFVTELGSERNDQWSKYCWSEEPFQRVGDNTFFGSYECTAVRTTATITYYPSSSELRFHKEYTDPKFDEIYTCDP